MYKYLVVENNGEAPIEAFTMLGVSSSRGQEDKIGQFGTGNKFGTIALMRHGIRPIIYSGTTKISFSTKNGNMAGQDYQQIVVKVGNKNYPTSMTMGFGALDWTKAEMGVREYISNALDNNDNTSGKVVVGFMNTHQGIEGKTRYFIPCTPTIEDYYRNLETHFLHFSGKPILPIMTKEKPSQMKVYRKGVFVREVDQQSLFDYNFHGGTIDECRNMSDSDACYYAYYQLRNAGSLKIWEEIFRNSNKDVFETGMIEFHAKMIAISNSEVVRQAWNNVHGNAMATCEASGEAAKLAEEAGNKVVMCRIGLFQMLCLAGAPNVLSQKEIQNNKRIMSPKPELVQLAKKVWTWLEQIGLTNNLPMPEIKEFVEIRMTNSGTMGFYSSGVVGINKDCTSSVQTLLEEFAHYITGAEDNTRIFQEFAFNIGARLIEELG